MLSRIFLFLHFFTSPWIGRALFRFPTTETTDRNTQAEEYDEGGQGVAYSDHNTANSGGGVSIHTCMPRQVFRAKKLNPETYVSAVCNIFERRLKNHDQVADTTHHRGHTKASTNRLVEIPTSLPLSWKKHRRLRSGRQRVSTLRPPLPAGTTSAGSGPESPSATPSTSTQLVRFMAQRRCRQLVVCVSLSPARRPSRMLLPEYRKSTGIALPCQRSSIAYFSTTRVPLPETVVFCCGTVPAPIFLLSNS